jgi:hypothetical protein
MPTLHLNGWRAIACAGIAATVSASAWGQQGGDEQRRAREAQRRAQAAVQQAQAERDGLRAERDAAVAARDNDRKAAEQRAGRAAARLSAALEASERLRAEVQRLGQEQQAAAQSHAQALAEIRSRAAEREQVLQQQIVVLQRERDERGLANGTLSRLLAERSAALQDAQRRHAALEIVARDAVDRFAARPVRLQALHADVLLGLRSVRIEDEAEALRQRIDAQRLPVPTAQ